MINLTINPNLSATPTQIQDQQSKLSGLYLTDQGPAPPMSAQTANLF